MEVRLKRRQDHTLIGLVNDCGVLAVLPDVVTVVSMESCAIPSQFRRASQSWRPPCYETATVLFPH